MKALTFFILVGIAIGLLAACRNSEDISSVPRISYSRYARVPNAAGKDSVIRLTFSYIDGDGDLGLADGDTFPPFNYSFSPFNKFYFNVFIDYREERNGKFVPITIPNSTDTVRFLYRMPKITPEGKNKAIKGEISILLEVSPYDVKPDSVKYIIQIADRQRHLSNYTETPVIPLSF